MKTFEVIHIDGAHVKIEAEDEQTARTQAMLNKWGPPKDNRTWDCSEWLGRGLSVREVA